MIRTTACKTAIAAAVTTMLLATASWAAAPTTINVTEEGEGGGAMTLVLEPATVKPGPAVFKVKNAAAVEPHEMLVVRLKSPDEKIVVDATKHRVDEKKLKSLGEVSDLKPGESGELKATLKAGTYLVFCNLKGHYEAGMASKLVVSP